MQYGNYVYCFSANPMNHDVRQSRNYQKASSFGGTRATRHRDDQKTPDGLFDLLHNAFCRRRIVMGNIVTDRLKIIEGAVIPLQLHLVRRAKNERTSSSVA